MAYLKESCHIFAQMIDGRLGNMMRETGSKVSNSIRAETPTERSFSSSVWAAFETGDFESAAARAALALRQDPDQPDLLRLHLLSLLALHRWEEAAETAGRLALLPLTRGSFDALLSEALAAGRVVQARNLVARAEREGGDGLDRTEVARAKARIALSLSDTKAARAILLKAIERDPDAAGLRSLMTEALMASGNAGQARAVMTHLGAVSGNAVPADPLPQARPARPGEFGR